MTQELMVKSIKMLTLFEILTSALAATSSLTTVKFPDLIANAREVNPSLLVLLMSRFFFVCKSFLTSFKFPCPAENNKSPSDEPEAELFYEIQLLHLEKLIACNYFGHSLSPFGTFANKI